MTFESEFPSLYEAETTGEGRWDCPTFHDCSPRCQDAVFRNQYSEDDVRNYCLDKQRVKDVLDVVKERLQNNLVHSDIICDEITKRLGLDK